MEQTLGTCAFTLDRVPCIRPGQRLADELAEHGWAQTDMALVLGRPVRLVNEVIHGKRGISVLTAVGLNDALGIDSTWWLQMQSHWQLEHGWRPGRRAAAEPGAPRGG